MFSTFLRNIDMYGQHYNFTLFNKSNYNSKGGGVLSLLTIACFIMSFFYFAKDFYKQENPRYINQMISEDEYPLYNISKNNMFATMRIENIEGEALNHTGFFDFDFVYYDYRLKSVPGQDGLHWVDNNLKGTSTKTFIVTRPDNSTYTVNKTISNRNINPSPMKCSDYNYKDMRVGKSRNLTGYTCLDMNNFTLGGYWEGTYVRYFDIFVYPCRNDSSRNYCRSNEEINRYITYEKPYFSIYTNYYFTQLSDFDAPLKVYFGTYWISIEKELGKYMYVYYRKANITQDTGLVTENILDYSVFGVDSVNVDSYHLDEVNDFFVRCSLYMIRKSDVFVVIYVKFQEAIALIGGILNVISLFFATLSGYINDHERSLEIANTLFDFSDFKNLEKLKKLVEEKEKPPHNHIQIKVFPPIVNSPENDILPQGLNVSNINMTNNKLDITRSDIPKIVVNSPGTVSPREASIIAVQRRGKKNNTSDSFSPMDLSGDSFQLGSVKINAEQRSTMRKMIEDKRSKEVDVKALLEDIRILLKEQERSKFNFDISIWLRLKSVCCFNSLTAEEKYFLKIFHRSREIISTKMDMINYLTFMQEYIGLKCIIFDDVQSLCLSFLEKPKLHEKSRFVKLNLNVEKRIKDIALYFAKNKILTEDEAKFYKLLSNDIKQLIAKHKNN